MNPTILFGVTAVIAIGYAFTRLRGRRLQKEAFIRSYVLPPRLIETLSKRHARLTEKDWLLVARALEEFFLIRARTDRAPIGMPSRGVDELWREFILDTREYERFCRSAFGHFFHHIPTPTTPQGAGIDRALRLTWAYACWEERISLSNPTRLPLLFVIDEQLDIPEGHRYSTAQFAGVADEFAAQFAAGAGVAAAISSAGNHS